MLESFTLNTFFLTTNSFKFDNNVKGVFNIGTIFFVDLVMEYKVCHREVDLVVDGVEDVLVKITLIWKVSIHYKNP